MVAENMYVMRYLVPSAPSPSAAAASSDSASSSGLSESADMFSITAFTCGSNPMSIMRSASSSTM